MFGSRRLVRSLALALVAALTACGGGGGGGSSVAPATLPGSGSTPLPGGGVTTPVGSGSLPTAAARMTILVPVSNGGATAARSRASVSPATQSVAITLVSVNGTAQTSAPVNADLTASSPNCSPTGAGLSCAVPLNLPIGRDIVSVATYSGTAQSGSQLGVAQTPVTIQANATNAVAVTLSGIVASLSVFAAQTSFTPGTPVSNVRVYIVALDATGNVILLPGTYDNPLTVQLSGAVGTFSFAKNAAAVTTGTTTVTSPSDILTVSYSGATSATGATFNVTSSNTAVAPASLGLSIGATGPLVVASSAPVLNLSALASPAPLPISGGKSPYTVTTGSGLAASGTGAGPFTVTASAYGTSTATVTDSAGSKTSIVVVTQAPPVVASPNPAPSTQAYPATATSITFPSSPLGYESFRLSGGDGTYTAVMSSTGTTTGTSASVSISGNAITIYAAATGTDFVVITSGGGSVTTSIKVTVSPSALSGSIATSGLAASSGSTIYLSSSNASALITPVGGAGVYSVLPSGCASPTPIANVTQNALGAVTVTPAGTGTCTLALRDNNGHTSSPITINVVPPMVVSGGTGSGSAISFSSSAASPLNISVTRAGATGIPAATGFTVTTGNTGVAQVNGGYLNAAATGGVLTFAVVPMGAGSTIMTIVDNTTQIAVAVAVGVGSGALTLAPGISSGGGVTTNGGVTYLLVGQTFSGPIAGGTAPYKVTASGTNAGACPAATGSGATVSGSSLYIYTAGATSPSTCAYTLADSAGNAIPVSIQVISPLSLLPQAGTITTPGDMHGFPGLQMEFSGTGGVADLKVAANTLYGGSGACAQLQVSSGNASVATVATALGGPFAQTTNNGYLYDGSSACDVYVQATGAGYTRISVGDGSSPVPGLTMNSIGAGVTTTTIPVVDQQRTPR